jgi:hypothetical protein
VPSAALARNRPPTPLAAETEAVVEAIKRSPRLSALLEKAAEQGKSEVDEFWRKLVESNDILEAVERHGLARTALSAESEYFAKL